MSSTKANRFNETRRHYQLNRAGDGGLANALRIREWTFNADVLPRDTELMAPSDLCSDRSRTVARSQASVEANHRRGKGKSLSLSRGPRDAAQTTRTVDPGQREKS